MTRPPADPFRVLGLEPAAAVGDDDVRGAWRRVAAATHPDRADGGDPAAFAAAAAAYTALRTAGGRGEALADLRTGSAATASGRPGRGALTPAVLAGRIRRGRPLRLAARAALAAGLGSVAVLAAGWQPASLAIIAGLATWLIRTGRADLAVLP